MFALAVGIAVVVIRNNQDKDTEKNETIKKLKQCLNSTEITEDMTELIIPSDQCNTNVTVIDLGKFRRLKNLTIDDNAFGDVEEVKLEGLEDLERVIIGNNTFRGRNGTFVMRDCPSLRQLVIGDSSFTEYNEFSISETPSLEEITIGDNCFGNVEEVNIVGMERVAEVNIGENSFANRAGSFTLAECEVVRVLRVGNNSFSRYNSCEMREVPLLELIDIGSGCFRGVESMEIMGMRKLDRVEIGEDSFSQLSVEDFSPQSIQLAADEMPHLYIKDCPLLRELLIGSNSFSGYSICEMDALPVIERITMGNSCFTSSSLELKSLRKIVM